ncbi:ADP,ATP carrier protein 1, mitochondrial [Capsicum baccatum]|uniref:ADP,ATP carrier protein 1, mitochondrial n=1 Tax=Capsicum baccatum TaxID=33114 RepID=A0A2G2XIS5_CAPBA|nr:ADP,ATP carrier protein 1, mitochondrial [Capsicum baccatum]
MATGRDLLETLHPVVQLALPRCSLSTHWIMHIPVLQMMPRLQRKEARDSSMSSEAVKYKSSLDAFSQIRGSQISGANILRAVAGAGVLDGYDKLQMIIFGKKYGSGAA